MWLSLKKLVEEEQYLESKSQIDDGEKGEKTYDVKKKEDIKEFGEDKREKYNTKKGNLGQKEEQ